LPRARTRGRPRSGRIAVPRADYPAPRRDVQPERVSRDQEAALHELLGRAFVDPSFPPPTRSVTDDERECALDKPGRREPTDRPAGGPSSCHVRAERVAGDQEAALDELEVAFEGAVLVLDRDHVVVADRVQRRKEAAPAD